MFLHAFLSFSLLLVCCEFNTYKGIVPLKSTRGDVEKIFGKPIPVPFSPYGGRYETGTRQIDFGYSRGRCSEDPGAGFDVPKDVVLDIEERFLDRVKFSELKVNMARFKRTPANIGSTTYDDEKNGVGIVVDAEGYIASITYYPTLKGRLRLGCK
jgi:hypothetical protein